MKFRKTFKPIFRRRREEKTDYRRRTTLLKSKVHRAVIRKSNTQAIVQFVSFEADGDKTIAQARAFDLKKYGWSLGTGSLPAAYLTGFLAGTVALKKGIKVVVVDIGLRPFEKQGFFTAVIRGISESGVDTRAGEGIEPPEDRLNGKHIEAYAKMTSKGSAVFSLAKKSVDIVKEVEAVKKNIAGNKTL